MNFSSIINNNGTVDFIKMYKILNKLNRKELYNFSQNWNENSIPKEIKIKVLNYIDRNGFSNKRFEKIIKKIQKGDLDVLTIFAKNATKQGYEEKAVAESLIRSNDVKTVYIGKEIVKYTENNIINNVILGNYKSNNNKYKPGCGLYIVHDKLYLDCAANIPTDAPKSVDLIVELKNNIHLIVYVKYISTKGGSQDNQFKDICNWVKNVNNLNMQCMVIVDGNYMNSIKYDEIKASGNNIIVCSTSTLYQELAKLNTKLDSEKNHI